MQRIEYETVDILQYEKQGFGEFAQDVLRLGCGLGGLIYIWNVFGLQIFVISPRWIYLRQIDKNGEKNLANIDLSTPFMI